MTDGSDSLSPSSRSSCSLPRSIPEGIPLARPVVGVSAIEPARVPDAMLLPASSAGAVVSDMACLILLLILFELVERVLLGVMLGIPAGPPSPGDDPIAAELDRTLLVGALTLRAAAAGAIIALVLRVRRQRFASVGLQRRGLSLNLVIGLATTLILYGLVFAAVLLLWLVLPKAEEQMGENARRIMALVPHLHPLGFAGLAAVIGLYEEVVFRGFLMTRLRRLTGSWALAVLLSSALFVALHAADQVTLALVHVTILSLVFSVVTIWRRSIIPAVVAHGLWNLSMFLYLDFLVGESWT